MPPECVKQRKFIFLIFKHRDVEERAREDLAAAAQSLFLSLV